MFSQGRACILFDKVALQGRENTQVPDSLPWKSTRKTTLKHPKCPPLTEEGWSRPKPQSHPDSEELKCPSIKPTSKGKSPNSGRACINGNTSCEVITANTKQNPNTSVFFFSGEGRSIPHGCSAGSYFWKPIILLCPRFLVYTSVSERGVRLFTAADRGCSEPMTQRWKAPSPVTNPVSHTSSWKWFFGFITTEVVYKIIKPGVGKQSAGSGAQAFTETSVLWLKRQKFVPSSTAPWIIQSNKCEGLWLIERRKWMKQLTKS